MQPQQQEHEGYRIELREREGKRVLLIDGAPTKYGQFPDGLYFLYEYSYDWSDDLIDVARNYVNYLLLAEKIRREREPDKKGGK